MTDWEKIRYDHALETLKQYRSGEITEPRFASIIVEWGKTHSLATLQTDIV